MADRVRMSGGMHSNQNVRIGPIQMLERNENNELQAFISLLEMSHNIQKPAVPEVASGLGLSYGGCSLAEPESLRVASLVVEQVIGSIFSCRSLMAASTYDPAKFTLSNLRDTMSVHLSPNQLIHYIPSTSSSRSSSSMFKNINSQNLNNNNNLEDSTTRGGGRRHSLQQLNVSSSIHQQRNNRRGSAQDINMMSDDQTSNQSSGRGISRLMVVGLPNVVNERLG